jgi:hypothetical protein
LLGGRRRGENRNHRAGRSLQRTPNFLVIFSSGLARIP